MQGRCCQIAARRPVIRCLTNFGSEGLSGEWTVVGRPSTEVVLATWRQADPPGEAMELLRFALGAPPLDSRHRVACRGQQVAAVGPAGLVAVHRAGHDQALAAVQRPRGLREARAQREREPEVGHHKA